MDADSGSRIQITARPGADTHPVWSPTGGKIAFVSDRDGVRQIYVMDSSGQFVTQLTFGSQNLHPNWSPDGLNIVFNSDRDGNQEIYMMDTDGENQRRLTFDNGGDGTPQWSPNTRRIVFTSDRGG